MVKYLFNGKMQFSYVPNRKNYFGFYSPYKETKEEGIYKHCFCLFKMTLCWDQARKRLIFYHSVKFPGRPDFLTLYSKKERLSVSQYCNQTNNNLNYYYNHKNSYNQSKWNPKRSKHPNPSPINNSAQFQYNKRDTQQSRSRVSPKNNLLIFHTSSFLVFCCFPSTLKYIIAS